MSRVKRAKGLQAFAKKLRKEMTSPEKLLWAKLRGNQLVNTGFRRQEPIGPYVADFVSYARKLVVEVDGHTHGDAATDARRDDWFAKTGFRTLRFSNSEVMTELEGVLATIAVAILETPTPTLPRKRGRERLQEPLPSKRGRETTNGARQ